ncbi:MAG: SUMF1/EgtB/PvdO family nonheme iron enzyme [bacterium]
MAKDELNYKLLSDEPILEYERSDDLEYEHAAGVLARAALFTDCPITIGIYGNWGTGKTSLMRLMKEIVEKEGRGENAAVAVWFNAWQYEREEHLIVPLIATIARDIKKKREEWQRLSLKDKTDKAASKAFSIMERGGKRVHDALRSVLYGISMKGKLGVPLLGELEISTSMKDMIERYEAVTQDTLMARSLYFDAFDQLRDLSHNPEIKKPQIVVFIDDLDRCFPEQAVRLLESIKLVLHQPKFSFVLGIYPQIIEEFIRNKYAAAYPLAAARTASDDDEKFRTRMNKYLDYFNEYLGKIVQVCHYVPERRPDQMHNYIRHLLEGAGVASEFLVEGISKENLFELIAEVGRRNPREIVRKINGLIVKWRIAKSKAGEEGAYGLIAGLINESFSDRISRGELQYKDFLDLLTYRTREEEFATYGKKLAHMMDTGDISKTDNQREKIRRLREKFETDKDKILTDLIEILAKDEQLYNILNSPPGLKWLSDKEYRAETRETYKEVDSREEASISDIHKATNLDHIIKGLRMVAIPAGEFTMGSPDNEVDRRNDETQHKVKLDSFQISPTPVTQAQYKAIMGENPSHFKGKGDDYENRPVEMVSWHDAVNFCNKLTELVKGKGRFNLPTEAQWEYACRAGTDTPFNTGDNLTTEQANYNGNYPYKNHPKGRYLEETTPVGSYPPNAWGLYDMHGNVWEWCQDWYGEGYYNECNQKGTVENPAGPEKGSPRVLRGGSWGRSAQRCRSAHRNYDMPANRDSYVGFRLVFVPQSVGSLSGHTLSNDELAECNERERRDGATGE